MANSHHMPLMDWSGDDIYENFKLYKQKLALYFEDENITEKPVRARKILRTIGDKGLRLLLGSTMTDAQQKEPKKLLEFFENQMPQSSATFRIHRLQLMKMSQKPEESIDSFVNRIRVFNQKCDFTEAELQERIIELTLSTTPNKDFRKELATQALGFPIKSLLEMGRKFEAIDRGEQQLQQLSLTDTTEEVNAMYKKKYKARTCGYCGGSHKKGECPAATSKCRECGRRGHWASVCRQVNVIDDSDEEDSSLNAVHATTNHFGMDDLFLG